MKKRFIAIVLSVLMTVSVISTSVFAAGGQGSDGWRSVSFEKGSGASSFGLDERYADKGTEETAQYSAKDIVRVSIILNDIPTVEKYSPDDISDNKAAESYRSKLRSNQDKVSDKISKTVLKGKKLDVVWNLTLAADIISANVEYGKTEDIKKLSEVKNVVIESYHNIENDGYVTDTADPEMYTAADMTNTYPIWENGYTGAGTTIAIIDTGIDVKHKSFDEGAFEYALGTLDEEADLVTKEDIAAVFDQLNIHKKMQGLTVDDVYISSKIPFAFNYVDGNLDVTHINDRQSEHGSHVAGIAAANRYVPDGNGGYEEALTSVKTQGQAPDAQLFVMKVYGINGGAYDSDYYAAVEDAIVLGLDAANLSLGSGTPGFSADPEFREIIDNIGKCNTTVTMSAGNAGYWSEHTYAGLPYAEDKNMTTSGTPSTTVNSLSVASVDNCGMTAPVIEFSGRKMSYTETTSYGADPFDTLLGEHEFIAVDGFGAAEDFAAVADVLPGKIFICSRGVNSFYIKADNAAENGAIATIIYNNVPEALTMNLTGYSHTLPVALISLEDGNFIKANAEKVTDGEGNVIYYTGTLRIPEGVLVTEHDLDYYVMSDFSSWGIPGSLLIKPEITAPGGNIYSVYGEATNENGIVEAVGNDRYELMSGTSMASPQIAGISALISEYIRKNDLTAKTGLTKRQLTASLLMGTSRPLLEESSDNYYSILKQGSGLVDTEAVFSTHTFITMNEDATASYADGKVKAEIGEISRNDKSFDFTFNVNNFGSAVSDYTMSADFFTQDYIEGLDFDAYGYVKLDAAGNEKTRLYMDLTTTDLQTYVVWTVNGVNVTAENDAKYDFDADGVLTYLDVQTILDYVTGNIDTFDLMENADLDGDGDIDTYDAYLVDDILKHVNVTVPAGESATVNVSVTLLDIDEYDINGAYVEGFVFVAEAEEDGVVSSIPVLGYYGNWYDFSMFDHASNMEIVYGTSGVTPYLAYELGKSAYNTNCFLIDYRDQGSYVYMGNMYYPDDVYMPERNAISPKDTLQGVRFTLIRNSDASEVVITDSDGKEIINKKYGQLPSAFYSLDSEEWKYMARKANIEFDPSTLEEGTAFTVTFRTAPEYYTMNNTADWDSFPDSTRLSQQFTVDGTAPEVLAVEFHYDSYAQAYDAVRITVRDNQYTSFVALTDEDENAICAVGSDNDPTAAPGSIRRILFDLTKKYEDLSELPDHLALFVFDYATNETAYYINLNEQEFAQDRKVEVSTDKLDLPVSVSGQVEASVTPWGKNCRVVWSSADNSIATVDDYGVITGVGIGSTVITAAAEDDPNIYAEINVSVFSLNRTYSGVLWDENSDKMFITFDPEDLYGYSVESGEPLPYPIASLCYGVDGTLFGATYRENKNTSELYIVNEDTYEVTYVGSSGIAYTDIAAAPAASAFAKHQYLAGTFSTYLLWVDTDDGEFRTAQDFSDYTLGGELVGVAFISSEIDNTGKSYIDKYYLIDISGELYYTELRIFEDEDPEEDLGTEILTVTDLGNIGDAVNVPFYQSLYLDTDGYLVWSRTYTGGNDSYVYIYIYDMTDTDDIIMYDFGALDYDVWPLGGIYEKNKSRAFAYSDLVTLDGAGTNGGVSAEAEAMIKSKNVRSKKSDQTASVSAVTEKLELPRAAVKAKAPGSVSFSSVSFDITAEEFMNNGLYTVSFDPDVYEIADFYFDAEYNAVNLVDGVFTLAFVEPDGYREDEVIATVWLRTVSDGDKTVTVTTEESNAGHPAASGSLFVSDVPVYSAPVWEWSEALDSATVTFIRSDGYMTALDATVAKTEENGMVTYTATVDFNGETHKDEKKEYIEYTVRFVDHDGTLISEEIYHYGSRVYVPEDPIRADDDKYTYTFKGWDKAVAKATEDVTYTATYEAEEKPQFLPGDINGDGHVNNKDVVILFRYLSGYDVEVCEIALDVNGDGYVNNKDITVLFRCLTEDEPELSDKPYIPVNGASVVFAVPEKIKAV